MEQRLSFAETKFEKKTTLRTRAGVRRLPLALLFAFAVTLLGVGKGWAQCTPNGQAGSTLNYNTCGGSSVTLEHTGADGRSKVLWSATEPPVAYSADFGTLGNFQLDANNTRNCIYANSDYGSAVAGAGDVQILMNNLGSFDPTVYKYFIIHYQITGYAYQASHLQIFFHSVNYPEDDEARSLLMFHESNSQAPNSNAGQALTVVIDASQHPAWTTGGTSQGGDWIL